MRVNRFTFGVKDLEGGISLIPALIGAFGFAEILTVLAEPVKRATINARRLGAAAHSRRAARTGARSCARA